LPDGIIVDCHLIYPLLSLTKLTELFAVLLNLKNF